MTTHSKREFLQGAVAAAAIPAAAAAVALPAVAAPAAPEADAELVALAAEIDRLCAIGEEIYGKRIDPFTETFLRLMRDGPGPSQEPIGPKERAALAFAYSHETGREAAIEERLWAKMTTIAAATPTGRAAKVRALLTHVCPIEWRGPKSNLDWEIEQARALLGEFAGLSEEELAMAGLFHVDA